MIFDSDSVVLSIFVSLPTNNFLTIPTPPAISTAASVVLVASVVSSNVTNPFTSKATPTARVDPSNVRLASSSSSPPPPAITTLSSVRSSTIKVFA